MAKMTDSEKKWTEALIPYIVTRVKNGESFEDALKGGMEDYAAIIEEGTVMESDRMKTARRILSMMVFADCHKKGALEIAQGARLSECRTSEL